jgi:membrane fusion protein, multidrug efflux system
MMTKRLTILAAAFAVAACGGDGDGGGAPQPVRVAAYTVQPEKVEVERQWHGRLEPLRTYAVQAPRGGRIAAIAARDGDAVRAGDVLLRMESPDIDARRSVLRERVQQLETELERWRALAESGAAGAGEVAEASLRLLEARDQASQLEAQAGTYVVRAPASGRVNTSLIGVGANVTEGQTLMQVEDAAALGVRLVVPAAETGFLEDPALLELRDDRGGMYPVERVVFTSDAHPAFVRADVYVRGAAGRRAATVVFSTTTEMLSVPWTSIASDGDRHWVARIDEGEPATIERRTVVLGQAHTHGVQILEGLVAGDRVVRYEPRSHAEGRAVVAHEEVAGAGT